MTALTLEYVLHATGEFDAETIFQAILSNRSFSRIEGVSRCCNLRWLDLSHNQIIRMENLDGLAHLVTLDLSFNKLGKIQNLQGMSALERLKLKSNPISRSQDLEGLQAVPKLRHLNLQNIDNTDFCPVCFQDDYRRTVLEYCPELVALDSRRRQLPDLEKELQRLDDVGDVELPEPTPWLGPKDLSLDDVQSHEGVALAMQPHIKDFEAAMTDVCEALKEAEELLKAQGLTE